RSAFYTWLNRHFKLGFKEPVIEQDYEPLKRDQLTVWDDAHPAPKADDPEFERSLLKWFTLDAQKQLEAAAAKPDSLHQEIGSALEVLIGRTYASAGDADWLIKNKKDQGSYVEMTGLITNKTYKEEIPVTWLYPKDWKGRTIVWLDDSGKASLFNPDGTVKAAVLKLVSAGATVVGADLLFQGEFSADNQSVKQTRTVANPREFAGYTYGYNHPLFAQRTHDVLTLVKYLRTAKVGTHPTPSTVEVAGFGISTGPIVAAARAVSGAEITHAVVDTNGFRFGKLLDYRDPQFLPGGAKYLDLPGFLAAGAPHPLWLAGEGTEPALVAKTYKDAGKANQLTTFTGESAQKESAAAEWLLK
ncbi:MAG: Acetyl xylan esterase, partial [Planctomycetaceae bacterium]|nr:Acetyl xylan esterase [Planctomycetaceae bacterium]